MLERMYGITPPEEIDTSRDRDSRPVDKDRGARRGLWAFRGRTP